MFVVSKPVMPRDIGSGLLSFLYPALQRREMLCSFAALPL